MCVQTRLILKLNKQHTLSASSRDYTYLTKPAGDVRDFQTLKAERGSPPFYILFYLIMHSEVLFTLFVCEFNMF